MSSSEVSRLSWMTLSQLEYLSAMAAYVLPEREKKSHTILWKGYWGAVGGEGGMAGLLGAYDIQVVHDNLDLIRSSLYSGQ